MSSLKINYSFIQVFVQGSQNLNRAVHQDVVAIEMLPEAEWSCPSSMVMVDEDEKEDNEDTGKEVQEMSGRAMAYVNWLM